MTRSTYEGVANPRTLSRREALTAMGAVAGVGPLLTLMARADQQAYRLAMFAADVTPPLGHPLMGGGREPALTIDDPLSARGLVFFGAGEPVVIVSVDWCEIRNTAYDRWRDLLAEAAQTSRERVLVTSIHQHDAPIADIEAQRILESHGSPGAIFDLAFHEQAVQRVAQALREGCQSARPITHLGVGQAKVKEVASNRRFQRPGGAVEFGRTSASLDPVAREQPEGTIDPWLKTVSFWDGETPVAALSAYATHPMSYYGKGGVSGDFVAHARRRRETDDGTIFQIYASGASGNITAGKYNDGAPENRPVLAEKMYHGMVAAWEATERRPLAGVEFRSVPLVLPVRSSQGFTPEGLENRLTTDPKPFGRCLAALGMAWRKRVAEGQSIDMPVLDLGPAQILLLPAESYVEFQLFAQTTRPDSFVLTMGYGECGPGYIPTEKAVQENDANLGEWCWVDPGCERLMQDAIAAVLKKQD